MKSGYWRGLLGIGLAVLLYAAGLLTAYLFGAFNPKERFEVIPATVTFVTPIGAGELKTLFKVDRATGRVWEYHSAQKGGSYWSEVEASSLATLEYGIKTNRTK